MNATISTAAKRRRMTRLEMLALTALGLVALRLAIAFPAQRGEEVAWRERDYVLYYQAHQLFKSDPEKLSEIQLYDLDRWCRSLALIARLRVSGVQSLTEEECQFVVQVLDEFCSDTHQFAGYRPIYESCAQSLARRRSVIALQREQHSHVRAVLLE
jgi:hypothetical protein